MSRKNWAGFRQSAAKRAIRAASCPAKETGSRLTARLTRRLYFGGLNLSNRRLDRLERLFGKVGIEFARVRYILNELLQKRLGIFGLNRMALSKDLAPSSFSKKAESFRTTFRILARSAAIVCQPLASDDDEWSPPRRFLNHRIGDPRIIRLIQKWLRAGILEDGAVTISDKGTGQGSVASPLLANVYLHYVFDLWAELWRRREAKGDMIIVRYADDIVVGFQHEADARRFWDEMRNGCGSFRYHCIRKRPA